MENLDLDDGNHVFRGVGLEHAISFTKGNPIPTSPREQMPLDWEVVEYALGDDISDMSEEDIEQAVQGMCWWYDGSKESIVGGLNTTSDFENAMGYAGDDGYVVALNLSNAESCEFGDSYEYVRNAKDVIVDGIYDVSKKVWMTCEEFLKQHNGDGLMESIHKRICNILQEAGFMESHRKPDVLGLFDEIQSQGQDFLYLIKVIRENSDNDRFIMGKIESLIIECIKSGDIERFVTEMEELRRTVEVEY